MRIQFITRHPGSEFHKEITKEQKGYMRVTSPLKNEAGVNGQRERKRERNVSAFGVRQKALAQLSKLIIRVPFLIPTHCHYLS